MSDFSTLLRGYVTEQTDRAQAVALDPASEARVVAWRGPPPPGPPGGGPPSWVLRVVALRAPRPAWRGPTSGSPPGSRG